MRYLLDTNIVLAIGNGTEPSVVTELVNNQKNECYLSVVALWEIAIKTSIDKLDVGMTVIEFANEFVSQGYPILDVELEHIFSLATLPGIHKDPFDRLLVAQTHRENMELLTTDSLLVGYGSSIKYIPK